MRQDREPRSRAADESSATAKTSGRTQPAVTADDGGTLDSTTPGDKASKGSAARSTEAADGTGNKQTTATEPNKPKRFAKTDGVGTERKARLAGPAKKVQGGSDVVRHRIAAVVWLIAVLAAVALSAGALLIALGANEQNAVVEPVLDLANRIDGPFWKVFDFYIENDQGVRIGPDTVKNHLVNWGLAAVAYLVGGWALDRVIRP